jgi:hypothetical protein
VSPEPVLWSLLQLRGLESFSFWPPYDPDVPNPVMKELEDAVCDVILKKNVVVQNERSQEMAEAEL